MNHPKIQVKMHSDLFLSPRLLTMNLFSAQEQVHAALKEIDHSTTKKRQVIKQLLETVELANQYLREAAHVSAAGDGILSSRAFRLNDDEQLLDEQVRLEYQSAETRRMLTEIHNVWRVRKQHRAKLGR